MDTDRYLYSGLTFGTNGCRLEFKQVGTGGASTSTIGADTSGQTNHFTDANNFSSHNSNMLDCCENNFAQHLGNGLFNQVIIKVIIIQYHQRVI